MANNLEFSTELGYARYQHYFRRIYHYYEKPATKVTLALLLTIFTTIFFAVFAIRPTLTTVAELQREIKDKREILEKMERKSAALASAQQQEEMAKPRLPLLDQALPQEINLQPLVVQIEAAASAHEIPLAAVAYKDFEYGRTNLPPATLVEVPFAIALEGDYPVLKPFLADILNLPRFSIFDTIALTEDGDQNAGVKMNLSMKAFYFTPGITQVKAPTNEAGEPAGEEEL